MDNILSAVVDQSRGDSGEDHSYENEKNEKDANRQLMVEDDDIYN